MGKAAGGKGRDGVGELTLEELLAFVKRASGRTPRWLTEPGRDWRKTWIGWLSEYPGPGFYGRTTVTRSARAVFMRLHSAEMLAWLALQCGVPASVVRTALERGEREVTSPSQGAAFRRLIGWSDIEPLLRGEIRGAIRTPAELRRVVARLSSASPETDRFTRAWDRRLRVQHEVREPWYEHQKEHWLGWLGDYDGPGAYGRKTRGASARDVYNRVVNPQMLVWLAEAAGVPTSEVRIACARALRRTSMSGMSAAIRRCIPWEAVEPLLVPLAPKSREAA